MDAQASLEDFFRSDWGRVVAYLIRVTGDWDLAEDAAQDAYTKALQRWPSDGIPTNPGAWLRTTARNAAVDRLRRARTGAEKIQEAAAGMLMRDDDEPNESGIADDRLRLIFTCCHPALPLDARVALTLRSLAGLTTAEIARAFMLPVETMAKRLVRAKGKIRDAAIPYRVPTADQLGDRTIAVLAVLYGVFNEGYSASAGADLVRSDLCAEAIRLARIVAELIPDEPEVLGLLSLMLLHDARRPGRLDTAGELVTLEDQDRALWNRAKVAEGAALLDEALGHRRPGPYQVMAAIAACHATAPRAADTDWPEIAALYTRLFEMVPTPVIALNRAVAVAMAEGPMAGLALLDVLDRDGSLADYYLMAATRADLLRRLGHKEESEVAYRRALDLASTDAERRFLTRRLVEMSASSTSDRA